MGSLRAADPTPTVARTGDGLKDRNHYDESCVAHAEGLPSQPPLLTCITTIVSVNAIITTTVVQAMMLYRREFTCSPISSRSLVSSSMNTRTNGSTTPFTTWDSTMIGTSGTRGISRTPAPATISRVYSQ